MLTDPREGLAPRGCEAALAALSVALSDGETSALSAAASADARAADDDQCGVSGAQSLAQLKEELLMTRRQEQGARQRNTLKVSAGNRATHLVAAVGGRRDLRGGVRSRSTAQPAPRTWEREQRYRRRILICEPFDPRCRLLARKIADQKRSVKTRPKELSTRLSRERGKGPFGRVRASDRTALKINS